MKLVLTVAAVAFVAAACSESILPTEPEIVLSPRFELAIVQGGCPPPFTLASVYTGDGATADRNGDGLACYLTHGRTDGDVETIFGITWTDNNVPLSQIGGCPNAFDLRFLSKGEGSDRDTNGDGLVCTRLSGNGGTIIIDNNHRT